ncbi:MAG: tryptophan 2,3-dioxygenase [Bacteroidetes bacterium]|nr:tryptophan 2,3-dioxygenase [Bacteroidota bacterium]
MSDRKPVHYSDYLQLDKILNAQLPESDKEKLEAHDEMLFIIIHQAYELWFKQLAYDLDSVIKLVSTPAINDNSPAMQTVVHRLNRMGTILRVLVHQIDILETMTPLDFLDFRDLLRPASGFQSWQFKLFEGRLGLKFENRHGQEYYISQLRPAEVELIKNSESQPSLLDLINAWLSRMPFFNDASLWKEFKTQHEPIPDMHPFWSEYKQVYASTLLEAEKGNLSAFDELFISENPQRSLSAAANRTALFILLYRGFPLLQQPFQLIQQLLEIDEQMATWRFRHVNMVHRMIGGRVGTGGSTGKEYLQGALQKHYVFKDFAILTSFLIPRTKLPELGTALQNKLGFTS